MTTAAAPQSPATPVRYRNAAEWLHDLGDVPLERIVFDPWPGTATEADVIRMDDHEDRLCELVNGTLVEKAPSFLASIIAGHLGSLLLDFVQPRRLGVVAGASAPFRLAHALVRMPSVSFVSYSRLPGGKLPNNLIAPFAPDIACEILRDGNTPGEMRRKLREYFDAGVRVVWIIDPKTRAATVYTGPAQFMRIDPDGKLTAGEVLPGLEISLADLFIDLPTS